MSGRLGDEALDIIFREARTHNAWKDEPVSDETLKELYELMKWGPTSANMSPARIIFVKSKEGKEKLAPALSEGNLKKTMEAPVTAIIGYDVKFYERLPELFPHAPEAKTWFNWSDEWAEMNAFRNGSLQGAYFMIAARSLGLDCGPMSGFDMTEFKQKNLTHRTSRSGPKAERKNSAHSLKRSSKPGQRRGISHGRWSVNSQQSRVGHPKTGKAPRWLRPSLLPMKMPYGVKRSDSTGFQSLSQFTMKIPMQNPCKF